MRDKRSGGAVQMPVGTAGAKSSGGAVGDGGLMAFRCIRQLEITLWPKTWVRSKDTIL